MTSDTFGNSRQTQLSNTLAAIFATEHDAREAIKQLHKAGFKQTWLGVLKKVDGETGEPLVDDKQGLSAFISADRLPLAKALRQHGLSEQQAQEVEAEVAPGCAVLTVYGEDNPDRAIELLDAAKAHVVESGETPQAVDIASASPRTGVDRDERKEADRERDDAERDVRNGNGTSVREDRPVQRDRVGVTSDRTMGGSTSRDMAGRDMMDADDTAYADASDLDTPSTNGGNGTSERSTYESDVFYQRS